MKEREAPVEEMLEDDDQELSEHSLSFDKFMDDIDRRKKLHESHRTEDRPSWGRLRDERYREDPRNRIRYGVKR